MQEVGLRKGYFNESHVEKMAKEPQPLLYGMIEKGHFGRFADMKYRLENDIEENREENIVEEENNEATENDEHGLYDILNEI